MYVCKVTMYVYQVTVYVCQMTIVTRNNSELFIINAVKIIKYRL